MFTQVEILIEDIEKADQNELLGKEIHEDSHTFRKAFMRLDQVDVYLRDSDDTLMLFIAGSMYIVKYDPDIIDIINE